MKKAFTLAETLIVLVVIGILAAILLPVARNIAPDRNLMKFKKAHTTLGNAIRELVQSEEYYLNGDLGVKPNGDLIDGNHTGDVTYMCNTLAEVLNIKEKNCSSVKNGVIDMDKFSPARLDILNKTQDEMKQELDDECANYTQAGSEIVLQDSVIIYQTSPAHTFGVPWGLIVPDNPAEEQYWASKGWRLFGCFTTDGNCCFPVDTGNKFDVSYKIFCVDIDGIGSGEAPFGYGIRADGKILAGKRATEWLEREK